MKRNIILFASICLSFASCDLDIKEFNLSQGLTATTEQHGLNTKTELYQGSKVVWSTGDAIRVFDVTRMGESSYTGSVYTLSPEFSGQNCGRFTGNDVKLASYADCRAVYPSDKVVGFDGSKVLVSMPSEQSIGDNSFVSGANVSVACGCADNNLQFKNACGLLAVNVSGVDEFSTIILTTAGNEALWGEGEIDVSNGVTEPVLVMTGAVTEERKSLTLRNAKQSAGVDGQFVEIGSSLDADGNTLSGDFVNDRTFYFVVPVNALADGFTVTINGQSGRYMEKFSGARAENRIERSMCVALPSVDFVDESALVIRTDVRNKAFYKDIFNDDGVGVYPNRGNLECFQEMVRRGFSYEYVEVKTNDTYVSSIANVPVAARNAMLKYYAGCDHDANGYLLYPDGEPRYKVIYVNGGWENTHAEAWTAQGRENIRRFFYNGGSYTGSCCGALLGTFRNQPGWTHSGQSPVTLTLALWPGFPQGMAGNFTTKFDIPKESPLMAYNDCGFDGRIDSVRHANGPFFPNPQQVPGTEILGVYSDPGCSGYNHPSSIAYKPSAYSGRFAVCGSHPETTITDECLFYMRALLSYAMDGVGIAKVKGILTNGEVREMTKSTEDNDPAFTKVGDKQCHHFAFGLPSGARNVTVRLESLDGFNLSLRMANGTFAFKEDAQYSVETGNSVKELHFDILPKGTWYVGVQCEDTVETDTDEYGVCYKGNIAVLNGAPYKISVSWDQATRKK